MLDRVAFLYLPCPSKHTVELHLPQLVGGQTARVMGIHFYHFRVFVIKF